MRWEDISRRLSNRSSTACRLHYQNYLEKRSEWDEERKDKLARLYERYFEPDTHMVVSRTIQSRALTDLLKPISGSRPICGLKWLKGFRFPGGQSKKCTGSSERPAWLVEHALFHSP